MEQRPTLPNATATLVLGICSIVSSVFLPIGLMLGIIGLSISRAGRRLFFSAPDQWVGYGNLNAGRILCILAIVLSVFWALYWCLRCVAWATPIF